MQIIESGPSGKRQPAAAQREVVRELYVATRASGAGAISCARVGRLGVNWWAHTWEVITSESREIKKPRIAPGCNLRNPQRV
jgi:hypothetical protein